MKRIVLLCLIAACTACGGPDHENAAAPQPAADAARQSPAAATAAAGAANPTEAEIAASPVYSRLPDPALRFDFDLRLKSDKQSTTTSGKARRGLALRYSGVPSTDLWSRIDAAFQRAGYAAKGARAVDGGGAARQAYASDTQRTITVSIPPSTGAAADSGVIWLGWDI